MRYFPQTPDKSAQKSRFLSGAAITQVLGKWTDGGQLGYGFAVLGAVVFVAMLAQLLLLKPKTANME